MLESRRSYGYGGTSTLPKQSLNKWEVCYRCDDGGFGIIGYVPLFTSYEDAVAFGEKFKSERSYVTEIIIRHPSKIFSNY